MSEIRVEQGKFYVGQRVYCYAEFCSNVHCVGKYGTVVYNNGGGSILVEFDENVHGHDGGGIGETKGRYGHCWWGNADGSLRALEEEISYEIKYSFDDLAGDDHA